MPLLPRKKRIRVILEGVGLLVVLVLLMFWLAGVWRAEVTPGPAMPLPAAGALNTQVVEQRSYPVLLQQVGTTRMETEAQVSSHTLAQVFEVLVREGDPVIGPNDKGGPTVMARLDDRDVQAKLMQAMAQELAAERAIEAAKARLGGSEAQLDSAKARLVQAEADYVRQQSLLKEGVATTQAAEHSRTERDIAAASVRSAQLDIEAAQGDMHRFSAEKEQSAAAVAQARVTLSYTVIQAPFTGRVVRKLIDVGDTVNPGQGLFQIETPLRPQLHANIAESLLPFVKPGEKVEVSIDTLNRTFEGTIAEVIPRVEPTTRTVLVKVALPPESTIVSGSFGRVNIPHGEYQTLVVPVGCVREVGQLHLVDVVDSSGHSHRRFVTLGEKHGNLVEILSGLNMNEKVIQP